MPKVFKYIIAIILILITLLVAIPFFIPLESYKDIIKAEAKKATGRDLQIDGGMSLSFLPNPAIKLHNVSLSSLPQAQSPHLVKVETAKAALSISSLLAGKIAISYIELEQPEINLEVLKDGTTTWDFSQAKQELNGTELNKGNDSKEKKLAALPILIEHISIKKGKLQYIKEGARELVDNINLDLNIGGINGPVKFNSDFKNHEQVFSIIGRVGELSGISAINTEVNALGNKAIIKGDLDFDKISFTGSLELNGNVKNLGLADALKEVPGDYNFMAALYYGNDSITLDSVVLSMGAINGKGKGNYNIKNANGSFNFNLTPGNIDIGVAAEKNSKGDLETKISLHAQKFKSLVEALKINIQDTLKVSEKEISFKGIANYQDQELSLKNIVFILDKNVLKGMVASKTKDQKTILSYDIQTEDAISLLSMFGSKLPIDVPEFRVKGEVIQVGGAKPKIFSQIEMPAITLNSQASATPASKATSQNATGQSHAASKQIFSDQPINLTSLQSFDGDFTIAIKKFIKGSLVFDNIKSKVQLANGVLTINSLTGGVFGGSLEGSGNISSQAGQPINIKAALKNAQLQNIVPNHNQFKVTQGVFNLKADIKTTGQSQLQYVNNLAGNISFSATKGRLSGFNLQKVLNTLTNANNLEGVLNVLDSSFSGGETAFESLEGGFVIDKGVANLTGFKLTADRTKATAVGNINLPAYTLDVTTTVEVDIKNMPPFKVNFYGPLDNPAHKFDTKALEKHLIQNVFKNVMNAIQGGKNKPEDLVKGILGFGGKKDSKEKGEGENTSTPSSSSGKPLDNLIKKGLEGLLN